MRVDKVIELLNKIYKPEDELMIDWVDKFQASVDNEEQWNIAVGMLEGGMESMIDMYYVQSVVDDAIEKVLNEEKI